MIDQAIVDLLALLPIEGPSGKERAVVAFLQRTLLDIGIPADHIRFDNAHQQSEYGGESGNMIVHIAGKQSEPRMMFSAHMDTVPDCVGCQPRLDRKYRRIVNDAVDKALGGDNRAGCAILLTLARELLPLNGNHPPIFLVFLIQEEVGLNGARGLDVSLLGDSLPTMCFNLDGRNVEEVATAVIGKDRFTIDIKGIGALAGSRVTEGVSAAIIASKALAELDSDGWHGQIVKPDGTGTANAGTFEGGKGSNIVMPTLRIAAEARSHDPAFRKQIVERWKEAFLSSAATVTNIHNQSGTVIFTPGPSYEAYALDDDASIVQKVLQAANLCDISVKLVRIDGGVDANCIVAHGIPTVNLNVGQRKIHSPDEWIDLHDFERANQLVLTIATRNP